VEHVTINQALARVAHWFAPVWAIRGELAQGALLLGGWTLLTAGVAALVPRSPWLVSAGLFALTLFGWRFLYLLGRDGLYALTRKAPRA
jgi:hypothetical protein